jgi:hypothetical protein
MEMVYPLSRNAMQYEMARRQSARRRLPLGVAYRDPSRGDGILATI